MCWLISSEGLYLYAIFHSAQVWNEMKSEFIYSIENAVMTLPHLAISIYKKKKIKINAFDVFEKRVKVWNSRWRVLSDERSFTYLAVYAYAAQQPSNTAHTTFIGLILPLERKGR